jgi:hypothetical protein
LWREHVLLARPEQQGKLAGERLPEASLFVKGGIFDRKHLSVRFMAAQPSVIYLKRHNDKAPAERNVGSNKYE